MNELQAKIIAYLKEDYEKDEISFQDMFAAMYALSKAKNDQEIVAVLNLFKKQITTFKKIIESLEFHQKYLVDPKLEAIKKKIFMNTVMSSDRKITKELIKSN